MLLIYLTRGKSLILRMALIFGLYHIASSQSLINNIEVGQKSNQKEEARRLVSSILNPEFLT